MERIKEREKIDLAILPGAVNTTSVTGKYFHIAEFRQLIAVVLAAAIAAGKSVVLQMVQAKDSLGTDVKNVTGAAATITAHTNSIAASADVSSAANTDVVTVNGTGFAKAAAASGTAWSTPAELAAAINANVTGVLATVSGNVVTVTSVDGKADVTLAKTENAGTVTLATVEAQGMVEISGADLDAENGFAYAAVKVTTDANITCSAPGGQGNGEVQSFPDRACYGPLRL